MRSVFLRYTLWVILPFAALALLTPGLGRRAVEDRMEGSPARLGGLAAALLRQEVGEVSGDLARRAPVLSAPDTTSPVIQAALRGDTVAGLGTFSGELVLSVALAEAATPEEGENEVGRGAGFTIRGITEPFPALSLASLRSRTGLGVALYLRGERILGEPETLGPEQLPPGAGVPPGQRYVPFPSSREKAVLLPLGPTPTGQSAVHLLVAPSAEGAPTPHLLGAARLLLSGLALGLMILAGGLFRRTGGGAPPKELLLAGTGLPLLGLWLAFWVLQGEIRTGQQDATQGELVRALALLKDGGEGLDVHEVDRATGYGATRTDPDGSTMSTLAEGPLLAAVETLPLPPTTSPVTGFLGEEGSGRAYGSMIEDSGGVLVLTAPEEDGEPAGAWLLLAALGGLVSLLALGFLFSASPEAPHQPRGMSLP
jgi:hypothetical protein